MSRIFEALQGTTALNHEANENLDRATVANQFGISDWSLESLAVVKPVLLSNHSLHALTVADSFIAEQFRLLQTRLQVIREQRSLKALLVTSSLAEEGKSFVALNLAVSLSQYGRRRVLLLEGDLRRPSQCADLGLGFLPGLTDWIQAGGPLSRFVYRISTLDICLLPAGSKVDHPVDTLSAQRTLDLLEQTSRVFDWVVVDSAPLVPLADAGVLSRMCDGTLVVIRRAKVMKSALVQALESVDLGKLVGFILNDFPGHYDYDYSKYYSSHNTTPRNYSQPSTNHTRVSG